MPDQLLIFQKIYELVLWLYPVINRIPKSHRLVLGRHLEEVGILLLILVINANKKNGKERIVLQDKMSDGLDCLRILVRLLKDLKIISIKQYALGSEKNNEIGRMLNGWMKTN